MQFLLVLREAKSEIISHENSSCFKGVYTEPLKNKTFLFLSSFARFAFSSLLYWSDALLSKLIPEVMDQPLKKNLLDKWGNWGYPLQQVFGEFVHLQAVQNV